MHWFWKRVLKPYPSHVFMLVKMLLYQYLMLCAVRWQTWLQCYWIDSTKWQGSSCEYTVLCKSLRRPIGFSTHFCHKYFFYPRLYTEHYSIVLQYKYPDKWHLSSKTKKNKKNKLQVSSLKSIRCVSIFLSFSSPGPLLRACDTRCNSQRTLIPILSQVQLHNAILPNVCEPLTITFICAFPKRLPQRREYRIA